MGTPGGITIQDLKYCILLIFILFLFLILIFVHVFLININTITIFNIKYDLRVYMLKSFG